MRRVADRDSARVRNRPQSALKASWSRGLPSYEVEEEHASRPPSSTSHSRLRFSGSRPHEPIRQNPADDLIPTQSQVALPSCLNNPFDDRDEHPCPLPMPPSGTAMVVRRRGGSAPRASSSRRSPPGYLRGPRHPQGVGAARDARRQPAGIVLPDVSRGETFEGKRFLMDAESDPDHIVRGG